MSPTSHPSQLNEIVQLIQCSYARSVLDVGVGFGKYGVLAREYLDIADGREAYHEWKVRIDGIEAFQEYVTPLYGYVYDRVFVGDARQIVPRLTRQYDLILLIDVLEHFSYDDGMALLRACLRVGRNVLIATPKNIGTQGQAFGNPFETHRFQWKRSHWRSLGPRFFVPHRRSLIGVIGPDAYRIWLRRYPLLVRLYGWLQARFARQQTAGPGTVIA